jgi:hypothetical protein
VRRRRESGIGSWEKGVGSREKKYASWEKGGGNRKQGVGKNREARSDERVATPAKAGVQGGWNYLRANGDVASCLLPPILDSGFRRNDDKDETWRLAREGGSRERAENGRNGRDERQECRRDA